MDRQALVVVRTGVAVATNVEVARSHWERMRRMLNAALDGRIPSPEGEESPSGDG